MVDRMRAEAHVGWGSGKHATEVHEGALAKK
jgi:cytochrome c oxidase subunit 1